MSSPCLCLPARRFAPCACALALLQPRWPCVSPTSAAEVSRLGMAAWIVRPTVVPAWPALEVSCWTRVVEPALGWHMLTVSWQDARSNAINQSSGIDDILKRAMGNRAAMFKRT